VKTQADSRSDEAVTVTYRRYLEARKAGLSIAESHLFADGDTDVGQLRLLVAGGCPARLIAQIVL
jgi:hypothetical protein